MYKHGLFFFLLFISTLVFISCGGSESNSSEFSSSKDTQYLTVSKAPATEFVSIFQNLLLEFSAELNPSSVDSTTAYIIDSLGNVFGSEVEVDELNASKMTFVPYRYFSPDNNYTIVITTGLQDTLGRSLSENFYHIFTTQAQEVETTALSIKSTKPSSNNINIDPSSDFYIEFNRFVSQENVLGDPILELRDSNNVLVDGVSKVFNSTISFIPSNDLNTTENYTLTLKSNVSDMFGNIYYVDSNLSSWNFTTTDSANSFNKNGISRISEYDLAKSSYIIRRLKQTATNSIVVIGTISGLELYKISYVVPFSKPIIELLYTQDLPSKVNSLATFGDSFIVVGTRENGIYSFEANDINITEKSHFPLTGTIYGVSLGLGSNAIVDRAYVVGPEHGMSIYSVNTDGTLENINHVDLNGSIMVDVVDATGYDEATMGDKRRIYVADYNDAMLVYDENGTLETKVDFNTSIRKIVSLEDYTGYTYGVAAISSTGIFKAFELNATANIYGDMELPLKVSNANTYIDSSDSSSKCFVSDTNRGAVVLDSYGSIILYPDGIMSSTILEDGSHNISYLLGVSENGKLGLYNIVSDTISPQVIATYPLNGDTIEVNTSLSVTIQDEKLDFATLNSSNFELIDLNTSQTIALDVNISGDYDTAICTLTPQTTLEDKNYKLIIKNTISDIVGNALNSGVSEEVNFSVQTTPLINASIILSGDVNVTEGASATYTISLNEPAITDLDIDINLTHISTTSSDIVFTNSVYTILAGETNTSFTIEAVDDSISDGVDIFAVSLAGTSSGGGFESLYIDTSSVITTLIDNDISGLSISDAIAVYEDAGSMTFSVSIDIVADDNVTFDYVTYDINTTVGSDYTSVSSTATILAGQRSVNINVPILNDSISEGIEIFGVTISNPSSNAIIVDANATGTIYDEVAVAVADTINGIEDYNITGNVLNNDIGDGVQVATFDVGPESNISAGSTAFGSEIYEFTLNQDGSFLFHPTNLNLNGTIDIHYTTTASTEANLTIDIPNDNIDAINDFVGPDSNITFNALDNDELDVTSIVSATVSTTISTPVLTDANLTLGTPLNIDYTGYSIYVTVDSNGSMNVYNQTMYDSDYITITYTTNTGSIGTSVVQSVYFGAQP